MINDILTETTCDPLEAQKGTLYLNGKSRNFNNKKIDILIDFSEGASINRRDCTDTLQLITVTDGQGGQYTCTFQDMSKTNALWKKLNAVKSALTPA